eukprot:COSAG01_NODE_74708_length_202_cov_84.097087_1_plen_43_part_10
MSYSPRASHAVQESSRRLTVPDAKTVVAQTTRLLALPVWNARH